jgi:spermidine synthase
MSHAQRRFLYITAAITGGAIMIVEILGAKMLAPYVGTSHFVWTAQIAVTLVALAVGYYAGGRLVDSSPRLGRLYVSIFIAALYLALSIVVTERLAYWSLRFSLAFGTLLASTILFFVPLALMAMVGPFLVRILTSSVTGVGGNMGRLTAISTFGSFIGTILIGYVLIPFLPNTMTMALTGILLLLIAAAWFVIWGRKRSPGFALFVLGLCVLLAWGGSQTQLRAGLDIVELHRVNSNFGLLQVIHARNTARRFYLNDYLTQNSYDTNTQQSLSMFTYMLHGLSRAYTPEIREVLCIGLGIGIVPMQFAKEGVRVDVVEINPAVVPIAQKFFDLDPSSMNIHIGDGRYFVNRSRKQYDSIILDAFLGESSPSHLMSRQAFTAMKRILKPAGTLVINCFGDFEPGRDFFVASLEKTLKAVFRQVRVHNERNGGNVLMVASPMEELKLLREPDYTQIHPSARGSVQGAFARIVETDPAHGIVLTDDYNPVEYYDAINRERFRRDLAFAMRHF